MKRLNATPLQRRIDPSDSRLQQLETSIGGALPSSYRQFLARFGKYMTWTTALRINAVPSVAAWQRYQDTGNGHGITTAK